MFMDFQLIETFRLIQQERTQHLRDRGFSSGVQLQKSAAQLTQTHNVDPPAHSAVECEPEWVGAAECLPKMDQPGNVLG